MILDERMEFCDATAVTTGTSLTLIGDVIDLGQTTNYIGDERTLFLVIEVATQITTSGSAGTIQFFLASDAQAAIATDGSATVHLSSIALLTDDAATINASSAANALANRSGTTYPTRPPVLVARLPQGAYERYLGILNDSETTAPNAGAINAFITDDPRVWRAYADNAAIS